VQKIKIKARGELRRSICSFPPVMLKFNSGNQETRTIRKKGSLKLVTPCKYLTTYEIYLLKEYLAYKMYNLVTPYSFETRLVRITYIDARNPKKTLTAYGFILENEKDMAARNHAELIETRGIQNNQISRSDFIRMAVFNYMIGNTDWWVTCQHNVKMLRPADQLPVKVVPVTYDFDYSGFVDSEYAAPDKSLPISQVTERYYMGICCAEEEMNQVLEEFTELTDQFMSTIDKFELLPKGYRKQSIKYIQSFYHSGPKDQILIRDLNETCQMFK
jgi:hypothetical protein